VQFHDDLRFASMPIEVQHFEGGMTDSFTKLLAFNQTGYKRVLSLAWDATMLQVWLLIFCRTPRCFTCTHSPWTSF